jgi:xanthine/uracil permease
VVTGTVITIIGGTLIPVATMSAGGAPFLRNDMRKIHLPPLALSGRIVLF